MSFYTILILMRIPRVYKRQSYDISYIILMSMGLILIININIDRHISISLKTFYTTRIKGDGDLIFLFCMFGSRAILDARILSLASF